jgi:hypothetical protein
MEVAFQGYLARVGASIRAVLLRNLLFGFVNSGIAPCCRFTISEGSIRKSEGIADSTFSFLSA